MEQITIYFNNEVLEKLGVTLEDLKKFECDDKMKRKILNQKYYQRNKEKLKQKRLEKLKN